MTPDLNTLDTQNRKRALEHASFIVEAPAGAGKTELLTQRYLKLLASVHSPEEIIALTFTNKAAAEMRNRILLSLENAQLQTVETAAHKLKTRELANAALLQSHEKAWDILNQPSRLRILTIDALCSSLTRQMPLLSKFGGQPAVSDDVESHYNDAARRAIATVAFENSPDAVVTTALRYMDNNSEKLTALLAKMLAMRDQWLPLAVQLHGLDVDAMNASTEAALQQLIAEKLQAAFTVLPPQIQQALMPLARFAASNLPESAEIASLRDWQLTLTTEASDLAQWQALAKFLLTKTPPQTYRKKPNVTNGFPPTDEGKSKVAAYVEVVSQLTDSDALAGVLNLPATATLADNQQVIQALTKLLMLAATHLWAVFQSAGEVDFVAIAQSAQLALENEQGATDLALTLDYKISHLLIDEFQDTSPVQMRLIEKLIEGWQVDDGRTLFCVGDPMQSIYRFRKADVSLFLQAAQHGIGHLPLTRLQLSRNNRSHPEVVRWINQAFGQVFPSNDNINQGAISYREFTATRASVAGEGTVIHPLILEKPTSIAPSPLRGRVGERVDNQMLSPLPNPLPQAGEGVNQHFQSQTEISDDEESPDAKRIEAEYVADLIAKLRVENPANKIAVLVRSRSHLKELVSEIRRNHASLKFQALEIEHLNQRQTVQDAFSLVCALHHRADRTHWLNILRAPWCGLTLADLHALAADNHQATIWQLMQDEARLHTLSEDGQLRLNHVKRILKQAFNGQGRQAVRRWVESTWLQLGGGQCLVDAGDIRDVQAFFDLVEKISRSGHVDIAALALGMQKLYAKPDIEADDSLQFLTIHKSKGLEFDTVILPALNRRPRNADHALVLWQEVMVDDHLHLLAAPFSTNAKAAKSDAASLYSFLKTLEEERSDNEIVRLLYVAATRTERQLHLIATIQANAKGEIKPAAKSLLKVLWPAVEAEFAKAQPYVSQKMAGKTLDLAQFIPQLQRLPSSVFMNATKETLINSKLPPPLAGEGWGEGEKSNTYPSPQPSDKTTKCPTKPASWQVSTNPTRGEGVNQRIPNAQENLQKDCGILAHLYMQLFATSDLNTWNQQRLQQCQPAMQKWLVQQGYTTLLAKQAAEQVLSALQTTLNSEAGQWVLQKHEQAASELSLMQTLNDGVKNHVIDRTFIHNGTRWIVDYKLTVLDENIDVSLAAEQHIPQLARYASLFSAESLPIKMAVLFLSAGKLVEL